MLCGYLYPAVSMIYPGCLAHWHGLLAFIASKDEGIFLASLEFPLQLCCIKCSPALTGLLVLAYGCCTIV